MATLAAATITDTLLLTERAVDKIKAVIASENNDALHLRVFIIGGGCSGFQYGFTLDELVAEDDTVIEQDGVSVLVDCLSFPYLQGATVDYLVSLEGSRFVIIDNPNAETTCGCGSSFAV